MQQNKNNSKYCEYHKKKKIGSYGKRYDDKNAVQHKVIVLIYYPIH